MNMIRLEINSAHLLRWAYSVRVPSEDTGYLLHAAMRTAFGELAPQPFASLHDTTAVLEILGYGEATCEALQERVVAGKTDVSSDLLRTVFRSVHTKPFPEQWQVGTLLLFQVLGCPLRRFRSDNTTRSVREKDAFLLDIEQARREGKAAPDRTTSYLSWLKEQLERNKAAALLEARITGQRFVHPLRRGKKGHEGAANRIGSRPEAQFEGLLRITDAAAFRDLIRRGIGRHRAFGYGMLLVRAG